MPQLVVVHEDDPRLAEYRGVPDAVLLEQRGLFVAEGRLVVRRLLAGGAFRARSALVTRAGLSAIADLVSDTDGIPVYVVPQGVMSGIAGFNVHRGCLALGERRTPLDPAALARAARTLVVVEQVANADNIGGVFRNAAAFAADGVLLDPRSTDPLYRKAIRTSVGAALQVPFARAGAWPDALDDLHAAGLTLVALTPSSDAEPLARVAARLATTRRALLLGHEGDGLTAAALEKSDVLARIPIAPGFDSLNVAAAAAIALYEFSRCSTS